MFRMSVSEITPVNRPDKRAPGRDAAGTVPNADPGRRGDSGAEPRLGARTVGASSGVAGADGDGDADSTTHMRWDWVATSLATV
jgi:hypothetical protein